MPDDPAVQMLVHSADSAINLLLQERKCPACVVITTDGTNVILRQYGIQPYEVVYLLNELVEKGRLLLVPPAGVA